MKRVPVNRPQTGYRSYLLRVWRPEAGGTHATIHEVTTGRCFAFPSLDELRSWLEEETREWSEERPVDGVID